MGKPTRAEIKERETAITQLRDIFAIRAEIDTQAQRTVYVILRSRAKSGMSRTVSLVVVQNGGLTDITRPAALALGWSRNSDGHLKVSGCGMNMAYHTVYELSGALYPSERGSALSSEWL